MLKPTNTIAETIQKLKQENWMLKNSIATFQENLDKNLASITELEPLATWEEVPDDGSPQY